MPFRLLFEGDCMSGRCLDELSFGEWVDFVFDRPAPKKGAERWYELQAADDYFYKDAALLLRRLTRLFKEADLLLSRYSTDQVVQGFWCFVSAFELPDLLEDKDLDFIVRRECIMSLEQVYRRLFRRPGFEKIAFMYWDPLAHSFDINHGMADDPDHRNIQNAMFEVLVKVLHSPERVNFLAALHGLGHLGHERGPEAIHKALESRKDLIEGDTDYAMACVKGNMDSQAPPQLIMS